MLSALHKAMAQSQPGLLQVCFQRHYFCLLRDLQPRARLMTSILLRHAAVQHCLPEIASLQHSPSEDVRLELLAMVDVAASLPGSPSLVHVAISIVHGLAGDQCPAVLRRALAAGALLLKMILNVLSSPSQDQAEQGTARDAWRLALEVSPPLECC